MPLCNAIVPMSTRTAQSIDCPLTLPLTLFTVTLSTHCPHLDMITCTHYCGTLMIYRQRPGSYLVTQQNLSVIPQSWIGSGKIPAAEAAKSCQQ